MALCALRSLEQQIQATKKEAEKAVTEYTRPFAHDRAHVVAIAVVQIIKTRPHDPVRAVAAYLRDEFTHIERQLIDDLRPSND
jgi:hypothetical protein